jgi:excisionase family DNA binding protein
MVKQREDTCDFLSLKQVGEILNISISTVRRLVSEKKLKVSEITDRLIRVRKSDLDEFIKTLGVK